MKTIKDAGEVRLLERLARFMPRTSDVIVGIGDDCAVVRSSPDDRRDILLTSDAVLEGVHFKSGVEPQTLGHKAAGRALSDIAAMGGEPDWLLVNLTLPPRTSARFIEAFYTGFNRLAHRFGSVAVGGDLSRGTRIAIHVFAIGHVPRGQALLRSGARPGDTIFVTGVLGDSLRSGRHLIFEPRLTEGRHLRSRATAAMDISDGLATDLRHLCAQSEVGAVLNESAIPVAPSLDRYARRSTRLRHALGDGEDYELLFTVPANRSQAFLNAWRKKFAMPCTAIGTIVKEKGRIECIGRNGKRRPLVHAGYAHY